MILPYARTASVGPICQITSLVSYLFSHFCYFFFIPVHISVTQVKDILKQTRVLDL